jgi:hypothetical protein
MIGGSASAGARCSLGRFLPGGMLVAGSASAGARCSLGRFLPGGSTSPPLRAKTSHGRQRAGRRGRWAMPCPTPPAPALAGGAPFGRACVLGPPKPRRGGAPPAHFFSPEKPATKSLHLVPTSCGSRTRSARSARRRRVPAEGGWPTASPYGLLFPHADGPAMSLGRAGGRYSPPVKTGPERTGHPPRRSPQSASPPVKTGPESAGHSPKRSPESASPPVKTGPESTGHPPTRSPQSASPPVKTPP